ncbi:response regulator [Aquimarina pacifica]|uniref:response regulator n=1 Tax=Aquimarina pacifica TaxID=1296415 RepID=UPI00046EC4A7|nr:response regulator [Aquimarina pacifica]
MEKKYTVLIIDDHPLISESYKSALHKLSSNKQDILFTIDVVHNCTDALEKITEASSNQKEIDLILLDMKLPPAPDKKIISGEDLGLKIKTLLPSSKIIVSTTFNDNFRIHSIFKSINPDGFLIKNDITPSELVVAIETVIIDPPYYSKTVIKQLRKEVANDFLLDDIDRKLLYELSIGSKMKDLPDVLPLSIAGIEKRKRHLKNIFNVQNENDRELLIKAKEKGFI